MLDLVLQQLAADRDAAVQRLVEFLRIPSVSTDPAYAPHVNDCAAWVAGRLRDLGLAVEVMPTDGHPVVVARTGEDDVMLPGAGPGAPRVLFYGHYDVQPADPVDKWSSPPFDPVIREGKVYARGALDDKGQCATFLEACRAFKAVHGKLPVPITFLIEGEEEMGSVNLPKFIEQNRDLLAADIAVVSDTGMWQPTPGSEPTVAITYALRGLVYFDIKLHGPKRDLHSGMYGGTLANPATVLARVIGELFDKDNRVTVPGFYDDVAEVSEEEYEQWDKLGFDEKAYFESIGSQPFGEANRATLERRWARPACDVNGLYGGYMGEGAKTVIPSFAGAKVSFRIPAHMDPRKVSKQFTEWLLSRDVGGCRWQITNHGEAWPVAVPLDSPYMTAARDAIQQATGRPAAVIREGATIPIVADFKNTLGLDTLFIGFGLESDSIHAPDEHFGLDRFHLGARVHAHLLSRLAKMLDRNAS